MTNSMGSAARLGTAGAVAIATVLAMGSPAAEAGIFSWLGGRNQDSGAEQQQQQQQPRRGFFGNRSGRYEPAPRPNSGVYEQAPEQDLAARQWITNPALGMPTLSMRNVEATRATIARYQAIVSQGGWPTVPAYAMRPGSRGQAVEILHRRLEVSGDLVGQSVPDLYDEPLTQAVRKFQVRHGLPPTGVIDRPTVDALNVPASLRLHQLQSNLRRLQTLTSSVANRYILVNVPAAQVEAVENGMVVSRHAAVVGKIDRPTPELSSKIQEINFNPYWNVPRSIVQKDLVPKGREFAQRGQDMLAAYRMQAFDPSGRPVPPHSIDWYGSAVYNYTFRQLPWEENSLGFVKLNFPNKDAVYLHDTPLKSLFGRSIRFESSGCVRVHNIEDLVAWILRDNPGWGIDRVLAMKATGEQADVRVAKPVPVYLAYVSAWTTPDGVVNFRPDIYNKDGAAVTASAY